MIARSGLFLLCCVCFAPLRGLAGDPLIETAAAGNASTVGGIQTCYAKVAFRVIPAGAKEPTLEYAGEYWREPTLCRVRQRCSRGFSGQTIDALIAHGQQRVVTEQPGPTPNTFAAGVQIADQWKQLIRVDVWQLGLLVLPRLDSEAKPRLSVSEAVARMAVKKVTAEKGKTGKLTRLTLEENPGDTFTVWLDPSVNWLVRKVERNTDTQVELGGKMVRFRRRDECEANGFSEVAAGTFFPTGVRIRSFVNDKLSVVHEAEFSEVSVNRLKTSPLPTRLPIRAGMMVTDEIKGLRYTADAAGNPSGKAMVFRHAPDSLLPAAPNPNEQPPPGPLTHTSTWLLVLAGLLATATAVLIYRRRFSKG